MWFKNKNQINNKNIIYVSIDGASIGVQSQFGTQIIYSERRMHSGNAKDMPMSMLLRDTLYALKHAHNKTIDEIIVILESPWVKELSISIKEKRLKPWEVTETAIATLIKKDQTVPKDSLFSKLLTHTIEQVKLNGYVYENPVGKITDEIKIEITKFFADEQIIALLNEHLENFWNKTPVIFKAGPEYVHNLRKEHTSGNELSIFLGSTETILRIYGTQTLHNKITIPFGLQQMLKNLSTAWSTTQKETLHWIELLIDKTLSIDESKRIEESIRSALIPLVEGLTEASTTLTNFSLQRPIKIFGVYHDWNKIMIYLLREKYFGAVFPHIDTTEVKEFSDSNLAENSKGDSLISIYTKSEKK